MVRSPHVAGKFYELEPERLKKQIEASFLHRLGPGELPTTNGIVERDIVACIVPHAGFMYSGPTAAHGYMALSRQKKPGRIVIFGTNHTGMGGIFSSAHENWATPLGVVDVDLEGVSRLGVGVDDYAHKFEHSIEVQLPFLQYVWKDIRFIPISVSAPVKETQEFERSIQELGDVLIIASSDFTHYEHAKDAKEKDSKAIEAILNLDEEGFLDVVKKYQATICGYAPIYMAIKVAKRLGASKAELLKYTNSGDITGDFNSVVAYAAIVFRK